MKTRIRRMFLKVTLLVVLGSFSRQASLAYLAG